MDLKTSICERLKKMTKCEGKDQKEREKTKTMTETKAEIKPGKVNWLSLHSPLSSSLPLSHALRPSFRICFDPVNLAVNLN